MPRGTLWQDGAGGGRVEGGGDPIQMFLLEL